VAAATAVGAAAAVAVCCWLLLELLFAVAVCWSCCWSCCWLLLELLFAVAVCWSCCWSCCSLFAVAVCCCCLLELLFAVCCCCLLLLLLELLFAVAVGVIVFLKQVLQTLSDRAGAPITASRGIFPGSHRVEDHVFQKSSIETTSERGIRVGGIPGALFKLLF
jgi:hypothetical protein